MDKASWKEDGDPENLAAAIKDADEWLRLIEENVIYGFWNFRDEKSIKRLQSCRRNLRNFLKMACEE